MRIAFGGIHTESSTYNPVLMREPDFKILEGDALLASPMFAFLKTGPYIPKPLFYARAIPGGPVSNDTYKCFRKKFIDRLRDECPLDGLYLAMHGAIYVDGMENAESDWIACAREIVGDDCIIAVSYDLHGNVSQCIVDNIDIFAAYRTAPHIDTQETMQRAWTMLVECLESGVTPGVAWAPVPVLLSGEQSSTDDEPASSLYSKLAEYDLKDGIQDSNLMIGYVWADEPRATACAVVTATNRANAEIVCSSIANSFWQAREDFSFGPLTGPLSSILETAISSRSNPVVLADSGDNPTGGGVGDRADVLRALLELNVSNALVAGLVDAPAVTLCVKTGEGADASLNIGGTLDVDGSQPVLCESHVLKIIGSHENADRQALININGVRVILSENRRPYHNLADFLLLGINPEQEMLIVVKSGYLSPELASIANPNLMALTQGVVSQAISNLASHRRAKNIYPWSRDIEFQPEVFFSKRWQND